MPESRDLKNGKKELEEIIKNINEKELFSYIFYLILRKIYHPEDILIDSVEIVDLEKKFNSKIVESIISNSDNFIININIFINKINKINKLLKNY